MVPRFYTFEGLGQNTQNGYVYTANINSHQYGIDYSLEFDDDLDGRVRIELEIYSEDNNEV